MSEIGTINTQIAMDIPAKTLRAMYVTMLKIRKFEERVAELVSKKRDHLSMPFIYWRSGCEKHQLPRRKLK